MKNMITEYMLRELIKGKVLTIDWTGISGNVELSEDFIREFQDSVDWKVISAKQILSEDFIAEFQDKVDWTEIPYSQKLSKEFIIEFQDKIDPDALYDAKLILASKREK